MVVKQQLLVIYFTENRGRSQAGNLAIANIEWYNWQGQTVVSVSV